MGKTTTIPPIAIIGPGRLGVALAVRAVRKRLTVSAVAGRTLAQARRAAERISLRTKAVSAEKAAAAGGLVLLTVPDDEIAPLCKRIAEARAFTGGSIVAHCSGALGSEVLAPARDLCGCSIASMHPMQTFPTAAAAIKKLKGSYFFCEGDARAVKILHKLAAALGGKPVTIPAGAKLLHHISATVACNYLTAILDAATEIATTAGIAKAQAMAAMEPLVRATVDNVFALGTKESLTGPIARGDLDTIRRHKQALAGLGDDINALYAVMGGYTTELALRAGSIDAAKAKKMLTVLLEEGSK